MKAVIVEIKKQDAAALTDDGRVVRVNNKGYSVGEVICFGKRRAKISVKGIVFAAAAAAVVLLSGVTAWAYVTPYTYVSLDVNPSIEYSVNRFNRVLTVKAVNGDGTDILKNLDLSNKTICDAVKDTVDQIYAAGYFNGSDPGNIMISTSSENTQDAQDLASDLQTTVQQAALNTNSIPIEVESVSVGRDWVLKARELGTTPGKLNLVQKLQAVSSDPDGIEMKSWLQKPVKDIMKAIKDEKKASETVDKGGEKASHSKETGSVNSGGGDSSAAAQSHISAPNSTAGTAGKLETAKPAGPAKAGGTLLPSKSGTSGSIVNKARENAAQKLDSKKAKKTKENPQPNKAEKSGKTDNINSGTNPNGNGNGESSSEEKKVSGKPEKPGSDEKKASEKPENPNSDEKKASEKPGNPNSDEKKVSEKPGKPGSEGKKASEKSEKSNSEGKKAPGRSEKSNSGNKPKFGNNQS